MLTMKELAVRAPAALSLAPAAHCSGKYTTLPTVRAVEALAEEGFVLVDARQDRAPAEDRWNAAAHARHLVRLRREGTEGFTKKQMLLGSVPEIIITNSSNGSSAFSMELGIFRLVCSNGLIVSDTLDAFDTVHRRTTVDAVIEQARSLSRMSRPLFEKIGRWSETRLSDADAAAFAVQALTLRLGVRAKDYDAASLLDVRREEDAEPTLWNLLNRAQENGMHGAVTGRSSGEAPRALRARPITAIGAELQFNRELWALAERFATEAA